MSRQPTRNTMRSDPSGAAHRHSESQERTSDTTYGRKRSTGPIRQQEAPDTSPIAAPTFLEGR